MKSKKILDTIVKTIQDKKGNNIVALDIRKISPMTDYIVVAEGTVDRHLDALKKNIVEECFRIGEKPNFIEGSGGSGWIVVDFVDVVVHLLTRPMRELYKIEQVYNDGRIVPIEKEALSKEVRSNG
jgi:ribosome-associated protein